MAWTAAVSCAALCGVASAQVSNTAEQPPFLTTCVERAVQSGFYVSRPEATRTESLYHDLPFAVNVPFDVRHEGGTVLILWRVTVQWDNPPAEWVEHAASFPDRCGDGLRPKIQDAGIYRQDGARLADESVSFRRNKMEWDAESPVPTTVVSNASICVMDETGAHVPFGNNATTDRFTIAPAKAGWHSLWFALRWGAWWPRKEPKLESVSGRLHVDMIVSRGTEWPKAQEVDYLFGRGKRPQEMLDDDLFWAKTFEIPFVLRRNGWVFDRVEAELTDTRVAQGTIRTEGQYASTTTIAAQASTGGPTPTFKLDVTQTHDRVPDWGRRAITEWKVGFPTKIPDYGLATMTFGGGIRKFDNHGVERSDVSTPELHFRWGSSLDYGLPGADFLQVPGLVMRTSEEGKRHPASLRESLINARGRDADDWWVGEPGRSTWTDGPLPGEEPYRQILSGEPPFLDGGDRRVLDDSYPVLVRMIGPWRVKGFYRRASDAERRSAAGGTNAGGIKTIVDERDPFWDDYPRLSKFIAEQMAVANGARAEATLEALPLEELQRSARKLALDLVPDASPELRNTASLSEIIAYVFQRAGRGIEDGVRATEETVRGETAIALSEKGFNEKLKLLRAKRDDIRARRQHLADLTRQAQDAVQKIVAEIEAVYLKTKTWHPELKLWKAHYREFGERIPFDIALAAKDTHTLRLAIAAAETEGNSAKTRLYEAELHRILGDPVGALYALRSAVAVDPNDPAAVKALTDAECAFLKSAIDKSQGAIREARAAFYGYMLERGFVSIPKELAKNRDLALSMAAVESSWTDDLWAVISTGIFGSMSALVDSEGGKPAAEADMLATTEKQMTTAFLGLNVLLRLRAKGIPFEKIAATNPDGTWKRNANGGWEGMKSTEIRDALQLKDVRGNLLSDAQAAQYGVAVREAMKLPDVQALVTNDRIGLKIGLEKGYWNARDVGDTWLEWFGDCTSVINIAGLLTMAKVGPAARSWIYWSESEIVALEAMAKSGQVISGTEAISNYVGLSRRLNAIGKSESVMRALQWHREHQRGLAFYDRAIWSVGQFVAIQGITLASAKGAEALVGPKASAILQFVLMFGTDSEMVMRLLQQKNIPPEKIRLLIVNQYLPATQVHLKRLAQIEKSSFEMLELFERVKRGRPLSAEDFVFLDRYFAKDWRKLVPNGQASHDVAIALGAGADGARIGVNNGAPEAGRQLSIGVQQESEEIAKAAEEARILADGLGKDTIPGPRPAPPASAYKPSTLVVNYSSDGSFNYPVPPRPKPGSRTARAMKLMDEDKFDEALKLFTEIRDDILNGVVKEDDELALKWNDLNMALCAELQGKKLGPPGPRVEGLTKPVTEAEIDAALGDPSNLEPLGVKGAVGEAPMRVKGRGLVIKEVHARNVEFDLLRAAEGDMVFAALARELGLDVPAIAVRVHRYSDGTVEKISLVIREVPGQQLKNKSAGEIFLLRKKIAEHKPLLTLLGDFDGKIDNHVVTDGGQVFSLDHMWADPLGEMSPMIGTPVDSDTRMAGAFGRDHWLTRAYKPGELERLLRGQSAGTAAKESELANLWGSSDADVFYRKTLVAEQAMTYQATKAQTDKLLELLDVKSDERLRSVLKGAFEQVHLNPAEVKFKVDKAIFAKRVDNLPFDEAEILKEVTREIQQNVDKSVNRAVEVLRKRAPRLDGDMRGFNDRNGIPLTMLKRAGPVREAAVATVLEFPKVRYVRDILKAA